MGRTVIARLPSVELGGRIDPSRANVGSCAGGVVPGMAALFGCTFSPLMP